MLPYAKSTDSRGQYHANKNFMKISGTNLEIYFFCLGRFMVESMEGLHQ